MRAKLKREVVIGDTRYVEAGDLSQNHFHALLVLVYVSRDVGGLVQGGDEIERILGGLNLGRLAFSGPPGFGWGSLLGRITLLRWGWRNVSGRKLDDVGHLCVF